MKYTIYLLLFLMVSLTSCNAIKTITGSEEPESPTHDIESVVKSGDYEERRETEICPINNCESQTETTLTVTRQRTLAQSVREDTSIGISAGVGIVGAAEFNLAVGKVYGVERLDSINYSNSLQIKAEPGTYPIFTIAWRENWAKGYVLVKHEGKEERIHYLFLKSFQAEIINVDYDNCNETGPTIELGDESWTIYYEQGEVAYVDGDFETVIIKMSRVIDVVPEKVPAYIYRGLAYYRQGFYSQAIDDYTKAIDMEPNNAIAYYDRGLACHYQGLYSQAIADYTKAIKLGDDYASSYEARGDAYLYNEQYNLAIGDYTRAIEIDPGYAIHYRNRGIAYYRQGLYGEAIADDTKAIEIDPDYADAYYSRALVYKVLDKKATAITDFEKYITLSSSPEWIERARQEIKELRGQ